MNYIQSLFGFGFTEPSPTPEPEPETPTTHLNLTTKTFNDRQEFYEGCFPYEQVSLHDLRYPQLANDFPDLKDEIIDVWLARSTFTLKVWVNYDGAFKRFYNDDRIEDCGKFRFTRKQCLKLAGMNAHCLEFKNIVFEVGTPFRTLAKVSIHIHNPTDFGVYVEDLTGEHHQLIEYLQEIRHCIYDSLSPPEGGNNGIILDEIIDMHEYFRKPVDKKDTITMQDDDGYSKGRCKGDWCVLKAPFDWFDNGGRAPPPKTIKTRFQPARVGFLNAGRPSFDNMLGGSMDEDADIYADDEDIPDWVYY